MKYIYDTNVFIDYFAGEETVERWFDQSFFEQNQLIMSTIVTIELLSYSGLSNEEDQAIREFLAQFKTIFIDREIEELTIKIRKQNKVKLPDAIIGTTALKENAILVTRNIDDFKAIKNLTIIDSFR